MNIDTLHITHEMLLMISSLDEFKGTWQIYGGIEAARLAHLRQSAIIESVGASARVEGISLSNPQIEQLHANLDIHLFSTNEEQMVFSYATALEIVASHPVENPLTADFIKQLHYDLMVHFKNTESHGQYVRLADRIAMARTGNTGPVFATTSFLDTSSLMTELVDWTDTNLASKSLHPLLIAAVFAVTFLEIHPFHVGNNRLSRLLTTLLLSKGGYTYAPFCSIEGVFEQDKEAYEAALLQTLETLSTDTPDWQPWVTYFLRSLVIEKEKLSVEIEREHPINAELPKISGRILDIARERGRVTVSDAARATGTSRNTIKDHMKALRNSGLIKSHGAGRGTWYTLV